MQQNNYAQLWHVVQGEGTPIVLIHGGPGAYDYLEPLSKLIDHDRFQIIRYEQRGSWRSQKKGPYTIETFVEDLEQLRIQLGLDKWIVCGHSWGASLALAYSAKYQSNVKALLYISGIGISPNWHDEYRINRLNRLNMEDKEEFLYLRQTLDSLNSDEKIYAKKRLRELSLKTDLFNQENVDKLPRFDGPYINNEVNQQISSEVNNYFGSIELKQGIHNLQLPSLFLHGETDPRPVKYVKQLSSSLPISTFSLIPDAGHYPWLDNPVIVGRKINNFLESL